MFPCPPPMTTSRSSQKLSNWSAIRDLSDLGTSLRWEWDWTQIHTRLLLIESNCIKNRYMPEVESPHHGQYDDVAEDGHGVHLLPENCHNIALLCILSVKLGYFCRNLCTNLPRLRNSPPCTAPCRWMPPSSSSSSAPPPPPPPGVRRGTRPRSRTCWVGCCGVDFQSLLLSSTVICTLCTKVTDSY